MGAEHGLDVRGFKGVRTLDAACRMGSGFGTLREIINQVVNVRQPALAAGFLSHRMCYFGALLARRSLFSYADMHCVGTGRVQDTACHFA